MMAPTRSLCLFLGLCLLVGALATGCAPSDHPPSPIQISLQASENDLPGVQSTDEGIRFTMSAQGTAELSFTAASALPYAVCVLRVVVDASELSYTSVEGKPLPVTVTDPADPNSRVIATHVTATEEGDLLIRRILRLDADGQATFTVGLGSIASPVRGSGLIRSVSCQPVEADGDYRVFTDQAQTIRFIFAAEDPEALGLSEAVIRDMVARLARCRQSIATLTGHLPVGSPASTFVFSEVLPCTALAGDPIFVNREELPRLAAAMEREYNNPAEELGKGSATAILCHELSHTFDVAAAPHTLAAYCFDQEFFATLKSIYALQTAGYSLTPDFLSAAPSLESGIYNHEVLLRRFLACYRLQNGQSWDEVSLILQDLAQPPQKEHVYAQYRTFWDMAAARIPSDPSCGFTESELQTLDQYFQAKSSP